MLNKETAIREEKVLNANVGEHIGYELGAKMIKNYCDEYNEVGAHFIGRNIIEKILSQPDCIGIKIFKALDEFTQQTYVFTGVDSDGKVILELTAITPCGEIKTSEGIVADRIRREGWFNDLL
jgi:hypothetical protein